jgi:hypothetical protein
VLRLRIRDGDDVVVREIEAVQCATLAQSAALLLALAYDPEMRSEQQSANDTAPHPARYDPAAGEGAQEPTDAHAPRPTTPVADKPAARRRPSPPPSRTPPTPEDALEPDVNEPEPASRTPLQLLVGLAAALDFGLLPSDPALGPRAFGELRVGSLRLGLALTLWLEQSATLSAPATRGARGEVMSASAELRACYEWLSGDAAFGPCLSGAAGFVTAETHGISTPVTRSAALLEVGGGLYVRVRLSGPWSLALDGSLLSPLQRPRFLVRTPQAAAELHTSASLDIVFASGIAHVFE